MKNYITMCTCMYVYVCMIMYECKHKCMYLCIKVYAYIYVCMYVRMCMYVWADILMCYMKMMSVCMRPAVYDDGFVYESVYPHGGLAHDVWVGL